ncbi:MAG: dihydropteroate synthase [Ignavibacteriales bacterium]|nr:dihydropteroate synthase [Ignavibacteriales bacterium]
MGVLNVTPDSFSDGGKYLNHDAAVAHGLAMVRDGADIIDVGGESTRPKGLYGQGAATVSVEEELQRVIPVIEQLASRVSVPISIDTYKSAVAEAAVNAGATIINDVSGMNFDPQIADVAARHGAALVLMHMLGTPATMQQNPQYTDVVKEVKEFLRMRIAAARRAGVPNVIVDPGLGFGKTLEHNLALIRNLREFRELGCPVMIGPSRKGFIGALLDVPVEERLLGTAAAVAAAIAHGADIVRVHDVKEMKQVCVVTDAIDRRGH